MPKISVCIPTFNRKDYLVETLDSVFAQSYRDFEVVIVDDGSTDGTGEMLERMEFPVEVRYHRQENAGDAAARNTLIGLAKGEYISFIDSDDLLMPDSLERMIKAMESAGGNAVVYGAYFGIDEHGNITKKCKRKLYSGNVTKYLFQDIFIHSCGSMFPRKALVELGGFDTSYKVCSDYSVWLQLSLKYEFIALEEPTFKRRRHSSNLSCPSAKNRLTELKVLETFYYQQGGDNAVPEKIAAERFAKEQYRVGKAAAAEADFEMAVEYFAKSFRSKPSFKSFFRLVVSKIRAIFAR